MSEEAKSARLLWNRKRGRFEVPAADTPGFEDYRLPTGALRASSNLLKRKCPIQTF
jgi:hypothetical protein